MDDWLTINQQMWNERVPVHLASDFYNIEGFKAGKPQLLGFEMDEMGPLDGLRVLQLQCHLGLEALDLARLHPTASVVGLDFSAPAIDAANHLAAEVRLADRARFVVGDVYHAANVLGGDRFDVLYTGKGSLNWLPDIDRWAAVVHDLLAPGGWLYLSEFHPVSRVLDEEQPVPKYDYFRTDPLLFEVPGSYADADAVTAHNSSVEWHHSISRIISALLASGLRLELFHEWDFTVFDQFPWLVTGDDGLRRWPGPGTLPLMYSIKAVRSER